MADVHEVGGKKRKWGTMRRQLKMLQKAASVWGSVFLLLLLLIFISSFFIGWLVGWLASFETILCNMASPETLNSPTLPF